jgi:hypothetical protein
MTIRSIVALALFSVVAGCGGSKNLGSKMDASDARPSDAGARDGAGDTRGPDAIAADAPVTDGRIPDAATPDVRRDGAVADTRLPDGAATPDSAATPDTATPDSAATPDTASNPDTATPDMAPGPIDTAEADTAPPTPDTAPPTPDTDPATDAGTDGGSVAGLDGPLVTACVGNIPLTAACALYCAAITSGCTGLSAQFPSEAECVTICTRPTWPCGAPGENGNTLSCRLAQLVPLASQPELAPVVCPNAGVNSLTCR